MQNVCHKQAKKFYRFWLVDVFPDFYQALVSYFIVLNWSTSFVITVSSRIFGVRFIWHFQTNRAILLLKSITINVFSFFTWALYKWTMLLREQKIGNNKRLRTDPFPPPPSFWEKNEDLGYNWHIFFFIRCERKKKLVIWLKYE